MSAQALEEIYVDKILAFALRRVRIKNRDLWDLLWLKQQHIKPALELLTSKLNDHQKTKEEFLELANNRAQSLVTDAQLKKDFRREMQCFLPAKIVNETVNNDRFWTYLSSEIPSLIREVEIFLSGRSKPSDFVM